MCGSIKSAIAAIVTFATASACTLPAKQTEDATPPQFELAISNGRVIDPETGLDAVRNVGISGGMIVEVSSSEISGDKEIDAHGLVVAPGFIDIHNHSPTPLGQYYQAFDGVTTSLELEVGAHSARDFGANLSDGARINYGASAGVLMARIAVLTDFQQTEPSAPPKLVGSGERPIDLIFTKVADADEIAAIRSQLVAALDDGAIGIGLPLDYASIAIGESELNMIFALAGERGVPVFVHVRRGMAGDPSGLDEAIEMARKHGARTLICHLSHNAIQNTALFLDKVREARREGVDVRAEVLPYNAGSVFIGAAAFSRDWKGIFGIDYGDIQLAATGEWLTEESFERLRREDPLAEIMHHYLREEWTRALVAAPDVIVSSDGLEIRSLEKNIPPQGVGTFAKLLGTYVRDEELLDLPTALAKVTILPAQLLEDGSPSFRQKGRIQVGMDADITIFDPVLIAPRATYMDAHQTSVGVEYLIVGGDTVIEGGVLQESNFPGALILSTR